MSYPIPRIIEMINSYDLEEPYTDQQRMRAAHIAVACHYGKRIFSPATCYTDLLHSEERAEDFKKVVRLYIAKTIKKEFIEALSANDTDKLNQIIERQKFAYDVLFAAEIKDREIAHEKLHEEKTAKKVVSDSVHQIEAVHATTGEDFSALAQKLKQSAAINDFVVVEEKDLATDEDMKNGTFNEWELI